MRIFFKSLFTTYRSQITNSGFTLIELLIVVGIMAIIFSLSVANYRGFQRRQHLESAARMIRADLRLAQQMALAGRIPDAVCETLRGYGFKWEDLDGDSRSGYTVGGICLTAGGSHVMRDLKTVRLPGGVEGGSLYCGYGPPGCNRFYFRTLEGGLVGLTGGANPKPISDDINITLNFSGDSTSVTVTPGGAIQ